MVDPTTANMQLAQPTRGSDTGTWDVPVNGNMTILDGAGGGITTIALTNATVTLSSAQFINKQIIFNGTLSANVAIVFPSTFIKSYEIFNQCAGSSANTVTLYVGSTASVGNVIACPSGEIFDCVNDGTNFRFKNLGRVGSYWDYAGSSVPAWISGCTIPPYLNCDGTTFSSATYPTLTVILGSTTLPNSKGKARFALDQGAGLISTAAGGFNVPTVGGTGGGMTTTLGTSNLPPYTPAGTIGGAIQQENSGAAGPSSPSVQSWPATNPVTATFSGTPQGGVSAPFTNLPPGYIGGLMMIRAG